MDVQAFGILGTMLGALIAALKYRAKVRHETLRTTKAILFYLLEIRHYILKLHEGNTKFPVEYLSYIKQLLAKQGVSMSEEDNSALVKTCRPLIRGFTIKQVNSNLTDLIPAYRQTLADLSKEDPLLAFYLKGKESFSSLIDSVMAHLDQVEKDASTNENNMLNSSLRSDLEDALTEFAVEELTNAVKKVSFRCGVFEYIKCIFIIKSSAKTNPAEMKRFDQIFENAFKHISAPKASESNAQCNSSEEVVQA